MWPDSLVYYMCSQQGSFSMSHVHCSVVCTAPLAVQTYGTSAASDCTLSLVSVSHLSILCFAVTQHVMRCTR